MKLYADSADLDQVLPLVRSGLVTGVTSNPTILARHGWTSADRPHLYAEFEAAGAGEIFLQAVGGTREAMLADARSLARLGRRIVVKVPATGDGFPVAAALAADGVPVLVTAVYSVAQVAYAASIGARYVAPYFGRLVDSGVDAAEFLLRIGNALAGTGADPLVASVRSVQAAEQLIDLGVRHLTAGVPVLRAMMLHPTSEQAAAEFERIASPVLV